MAATTPMQVVLVGAGTLGITLLLSTLLYNSIWGGAAECRGLGVYSGIFNWENSYLDVLICSMTCAQYILEKCEGTQNT